MLQPQSRIDCLPVEMSVPGCSLVRAEAVCWIVGILPVVVVPAPYTHAWLVLVGLSSG